MTIRQTLLTAAFLMGTAYGAHADVLYDSSQSGLGYGAYVANYPNLGDGALAQSFSTGAVPGMLADVTLSFLTNIDPFSLPSGPAGSFVVQLFSDAGGATPTPGAAIMTLGTVLDSDIAGFMTFDGQNTPLNPMTRYWVVVTDPYAGVDPAFGTIAVWEQAGDSAGTGVDSQWAYADGISEPLDPSNVITSDQFATAPFVMTVDIPEPGTLALFSIGALALASRRARRKG